MIHRRVEYIITCDADHVLGKERCPTVGAHAFNSDTQADCAASAGRDGWQRVSKRFWFCPSCAKNFIKELPDDQ